MPRRLAIAVALALAACGPADPSAARFDRSLVEANQRLVAAGTRFGRSLQPLLHGERGDATRVRAAHQELARVIASLRTELAALQVPDSDSARAFHEAERAFLDAQARLIEDDYARIVELAAGETLGEDERREIDRIIQRSAAAEEASLRDLRVRQQAFWEHHGL